jgi:chromosome segregation ATPase
VRTATSDTDASLKRLNKRVAALENGQDEIRGQSSTVRKEVTALTEEVEALEAEVNAIGRRIRQLNANGGA